ncbi:Uncharacterised protein [Vibrio cholerae]|nr:Uncharacterised protein [Vibrio cholerae]
MVNGLLPSAPWQAAQVRDLALPASILPWAHTEQLAKTLKISANFFMTFHL